uniref:Putative RNA-directed DNA polymerase, eukaryota, reverse transcriptase zinc-binding domain protein n=1 Tax=Tanacetum cinerariifolium TaxID=118510 RepID=A0A6L2KBH3_TANCI|nr:putative RNA-directed DNA polymerase, eukaryota, reverse transcriptase zinc-binding domain protein [Tanacetum cinerariifolium]
MGNGADVSIPLESIHTISARFANTAYGFFLEKWVAYRMFLTMSKILGNPDVNLQKEDVGNVIVWVKFYGVHMTTFSADDLSIIATKIGTRLMLDSYTYDMCMQSWGRSSYVTAMIELRVAEELADTFVVAIPKFVGERKDCFERELIEWKLLLVNDDGKPLPKVVSTVNANIDSEVKEVFDEHTTFMASTSSKSGSDSGYYTNSLWEQWEETKRDDDYDSYDDDLYDSHDMSDNLQAICDEFDITYKIIAKILANRLALVLPTVIGESQMAFIKGYASVLINGSPTKEFKIEKGLRQGDPLSPFLFILAVEALNVVFLEARNKRIFLGTEVGIDKVPISHLQFTDDALIIGQWTLANAKNLSRILICFHLASGLKVNFNKSKLFGIGVSNYDLNFVASSIGCQPSHLPCIYLGLPIGANMSRLYNWSPLVERFQKRFCIWKSKSLSYGGRLTLLKSVLGNLTVYFFSTFKAPTTIIKKLESARRIFFRVAIWMKRRWLG